MVSVRILIVDDHEVIRRGMRALLAERSDWSVCGEAVDGLEAIEKAEQLRPDIILMDLSMPRMGGAEATRILRERLDQASVIIVSQNDPGAVRMQVSQLSVAGFVPKTDLSRDLLAVIDRVVRERLQSGVQVSGDQPIGASWLSGGGRLGALIRDYDWSRTPLGPMEFWSQSLRTAVNLMLNSQHPMWIGWGPEMTFLYNDAYISVLSLAKHPASLGRPARQVWSEIWDVCGPLAEKVFSRGEPSFVEDVQLFMNRGDYVEETYYSFSYSPIYDETGKVAGLFCPSAETSAKVLNARRLRTLAKLSSGASSQKSTRAATASSLAALSENPDDIPFALLYLLDADSEAAALEGTVRLASGLQGLTPRQVRFDAGVPSPWPLREVISTGTYKVVSLDGLHSLPYGPARQPLREALVLPVISLGLERPVGVLIVGVNPCRPLDSEHRTFFALVADQIATAIKAARAAEQEKKRADLLAEIDQAKTVFFSNVSHEFRTPLTLMLSPLEEALSTANYLAPEDRERLSVAHRNSLRLLKLVNTLLDFSRMEAGRTQAAFEPTDLSSFTAELASLFRSAIERAGLKLVLNLSPLPAPVYVDREMWEKIVFNLLSNAFKFTFEGQIDVSLRQKGNFAELSVGDSGTGIPSSELPHLFERFHRVKGARGRTLEGSGIGLALVQELARLHGGAVRAESTHGRGSVFTVAIPFGKDHIAPDRVVASRPAGAAASLAHVYVEEALRWLPSDESGTLKTSDDVLPELPHLATTPGPESPADSQTGGSRKRILVADDNQDMRDYISRLLGSKYEVEAVPDGKSALNAIRREAPDLIVSDVMMPQLDGFGLLRELRADPVVATVPVILLSARAGEESRIEGISSGADDYLIKPFSARELLARVDTHLRIASTRRNVEERLRHSEEELRILQHVGSTLARGLDLQKIVQLATDAGRELSEAAFGAFFYNVIDTSGEKYMLYTLSGASPEAFAKFPMPRNTGVFAPTFRGEATLRIADVTADPRYGKSAPYYGMPPGHLPVRSYLAVPVVSRSGEVLGGLFFGHPEVGVFTERAERLVQGVAAQASIAIDNARLFEEAKSAHARLRAATDAGGLGSWDWDIANNRISWSDRIYEFHGLEPGAFDGTLEGFARLVHPEDRSSVHVALHQALASGRPYELEFRVVRPDGTIRWLFTRAEVTRDASGAPTRLIGITHDVTDRKQVQDRLRESEESTRMALNASRTVAWNWDLSTGIVSHSENAPDVLGLPVELNASEGFKIVHPEDIERLQAAIHDALASRSEFQADFRAKRSEHILWFHTRARVESDSAGNPLRIIGTTTDITDRKSDERVSGLLAAIVESTDDAIISKNLDGIITSWNRGATRLFYYKAEEAIGRSILLIIPDDRHDEELDILARLKRGERIEHLETVRRRKDGSLFDVSLTISPVRDHSGRVVGVSKVARDISERKRAEKSLGDHARQQRVLFLLADKLHRAESRDQVFDVALEAVFGALECDRASILLFDPANVMQFVASRGLSEDYRKAASGHSPWKPQDSNAVPICMNDVSAVPLDPSLKAAILKEGIRSLAFIPLLSGDKLVGKFMVYFDRPHAFTESELELARTIARQLSFGLDQKKAEVELRASEERYRLLAESLEAEVRARTSELEERNRHVLRQTTQLQELTRRLMKIQDDERRHFARELHDSAGQTLAGLSMSLSRIVRQSAVRAPDLNALAEETLELAHQLSREIRTTSYLLHPPLLDETGLSAALDWYLRGAAERSGLEIAFHLPDDFGRLPRDLEVAIYRVVQETLTNIHRHSQSKSAEISLSRGEGLIALTIRDHGKGIPPEKLAQIRSQASGVGIRGMSERIHQFGGELRIESDSAGTAIFVTFPDVEAASSSGSAERTSDASVPAPEPEPPARQVSS